MGIHEMKIRHIIGFDKINNLVLECRRHIRKSPPAHNEPQRDK